MVLPDWLQASAAVVRKGRIPTRRRRARWRAEREFEQVIAQLRPGDIAIDCGANIGLFTRKMAATGATVYAFEPDPYAFKVLRRDFSSIPHVMIRDCAVGTSQKRVHLYRSSEFSSDPLKSTISSSLFYSKQNMDTKSPIIVDQIDLCSFIAGMQSSIHIIKMDIEGAEVEIIEKLIETGLIHKIRSMFVETHEKQIPELTERMEAIKSYVKHKGLRSINLDWQ